MRLFSFLVFLVLQIVFLPLAILGVALVTYRQLLVSKRLGVSQTMVEVLNGRWTMHVFGMRADDATVRLSAVVPNTSTLGMWLVVFPIWAKYRLSGQYFGYPRIPEEGKETVGDAVVARTLHIDRIVQRVIGDVDQVVLLGAGYDTRPYGTLKRSGLTFFEVDLPATQQLKVASLHEAGIDADHVTFVPVDLRQENTFEKLRTVGYDPRKKSLFVWEGVTLYFSEGNVRKTIRDIRENSAPGSVVVADIYSERLVRMGSGKLARKTLELTDEPLIFGLPLETDHEECLRRFLKSEGTRVGEAVFMGVRNKGGPIMVVVEFGV